MIRTIIIPIEESLHSAAALDHLWRLAPLYQARVYGLSVIDVQTLVQGLEVTEETRRLLERESGERLSHVEEKCHDLKLRFVSDTLIGEPVEEIAGYAPRGDMLIMGEDPSDTPSGYETQRARVRDTLNRVNRPMFIARKGHERLERILTGYDGSEKAGHALQWSADLAEKAASELLVYTATDTREQGVRLIEEAGAYLQGYMVSWHPVLFEGAVEDGLSRTMNKTGIDLIVVGAHGHGRLHELAFGSTTGFILSYLTPSLLIYR